MSELNPETEELTEETTPVTGDFADERVPAETPDKDEEVLDRLMEDGDTIASDNDDTPDDEPESQEQGQAEDWDDLVKVLRRDNVPMAVIEATDEDTLREWVNKSQKRQSDVDEYGSRLKDLADRLSKAKKPVPKTPTRKAKTPNRKQTRMRPRWLSLKSWLMSSATKQRRLLSK